MRSYTVRLATAPLILMKLPSAQSEVRHFDAGFEAECRADLAERRLRGNCPSGKKSSRSSLQLSGKSVLKVKSQKHKNLRLWG
jgi:hypothetical protein